MPSNQQLLRLARRHAHILPARAIISTSVAGPRIKLGRCQALIYKRTDGKHSVMVECAAEARVQSRQKVCRAVPADTRRGWADPKQAIFFAARALRCIDRR